MPEMGYDPEGGDCLYACMMVLRPALLSLWMDITASAWHDVGSMTGVESVIYLCDF